MLPRGSFDAVRLDMRAHPLLVLSGALALAACAKEEAKAERTWRCNSVALPGGGGGADGEYDCKAGEADCPPKGASPGTSGGAGSGGATTGGTSDGTSGTTSSGGTGAGTSSGGTSGGTSGSGAAGHEDDAVVRRGLRLERRAVGPGRRRR